MPMPPSAALGAGSPLEPTGKEIEGLPRGWATSWRQSPSWPAAFPGLWIVRESPEPPKLLWVGHDREAVPPPAKTGLGERDRPAQDPRLFRFFARPKLKAPASTPRMLTGPISETRT